MVGANRQLATPPPPPLPLRIDEYTYQVPSCSGCDLGSLLNTTAKRVQSMHFPHRYVDLSDLTTTPQTINPPPWASGVPAVANSRYPSAVPGEAWSPLPTNPGVSGYEAQDHPQWVDLVSSTANVLPHVLTLPWFDRFDTKYHTLCAGSSCTPSMGPCIRDEATGALVSCFDFSKMTELDWTYRQLGQITGSMVRRSLARKRAQRSARLTPSPPPVPHRTSAL